MSDMNYTDSDEVRNELEQMIDGQGLSALVDLLAEICSEKAEHIQQSYGDKSLASSWRRDSSKLLKLSAKL